LGFSGVVGWKETHWKKMSVQEEDECRRKVEKYKSRLVVKGYSQVRGIDFGDFFLLLPR